MSRTKDGAQIRRMEPEDIDAILASDRKMSGVQRIRSMPHDRLLPDRLAHQGQAAMDI